jgi:tRNA A37 threonylcarbamoyltransferase TsaD
VEKALRAARRFQFRRIVVAGGVAANRRLRQVFPERASARGVEVFFPPPGLCTDNAATVAACALPPLPGTWPFRSPFPFSRSQPPASRLVLSGL